MSTGYGWEGIRQVCATLLGARHVPECLCGGSASTWDAVTNYVRPFLSLSEDRCLQNIYAILSSGVGSI